jgi:DNA-binding XRE family transcriptional regulator
MRPHIKAAQRKGLPAAMRRELTEAHRRCGWSQAELGQRVGLPQVHISGIETGKVVPRFDTLIELVRVLERDLLMVPRALVPAVQALVRGHGRTGGSEGERPLYADLSNEADEGDEA